MFPRLFATGSAAAACLFAVSAASLQAQTTYASNYTQVWTAGDTLSGLRTPGAGYTISMFSANGTNASNGQVMGKLFTANGQTNGAPLSLQVGQTFLIRMGGEDSGGRTGITNGGRIGFTLGAGTDLFAGDSAIARATNAARLRVDFVGGGSSARFIGDSLVTSGMPNFTQFKAGLYYAVDMLSADEFTLRWGTTAAATDGIFNMANFGGTAGGSIGKIQIYNLGANMGASYSNIIVSNAPYLNFSNSAGQTSNITGLVSDNGATANDLVKNGGGTVRLSNAGNTYSGSTTVSNGVLLVDGGIGGSGVTVSAGARLGGSGTIAATVGGAGTVDPGNSPGILTANAVDASGGLDFAFEFTSLNPVYANSTASVNDIFRLTSATPFIASLAAGNVVDVYFNLASISEGQAYAGGFFTDESADFLSSIAGASYNFFVRGDGAGTDATYEGNGYYSLSTWDETLSIDIGTLAVASADFEGGTVEDGRIMQFNVVPEPSTWALLLTGGALVALRLRRRQS